MCAKDRKMVENKKKYIIIINFMISFLNREETKKEIKQKSMTSYNAMLNTGMSRAFGWKAFVVTWSGYTKEKQRYEEDSLLIQFHCAEDNTEYTIRRQLRRPLEAGSEIFFMLSPGAVVQTTTSMFLPFPSHIDEIPADDNAITELFKTCARLVNELKYTRELLGNFEFIMQNSKNVVDRDARTRADALAAKLEVTDGNLKEKIEDAKIEISLIGCDLKAAETVRANFELSLHVAGASTDEVEALIKTDAVLTLRNNPHRHAALRLHTADVLYQFYNPLNPGFYVRQRCGAAHRVIYHSSLPAYTASGFKWTFGEQLTEKLVTGLLADFDYIKLDDYFVHARSFQLARGTVAAIRALMGHVRIPLEVDWPKADKDQKHAVREITKASCGIIHGEGGCGKTALVVQLMKASKAAGDLVLGAAFMGAAVRNLKRVMTAVPELIDVGCYTLHFLLAAYEHVFAAISRSNGKLTVVIDEGFAAGCELLYDFLVTYVGRIGATNLRIYFIGDHGQLPPYKSWSPLTALLSAANGLDMEVPWEGRGFPVAPWVRAYALTVNHRNSEGAADLLAGVRDVRAGKRPRTQLVDIRSWEDGRKHAPSGWRASNVSDLFALNDTCLFVAGTNETVRRYNHLLRPLANPLATEAVTHKLFLNDLVIICKNQNIQPESLYEAREDGPVTAFTKIAGKQVALGTFTPKPPSDPIFPMCHKLFNGDSGVFVMIQGISERVAKPVESDNDAEVPVVDRPRYGLLLPSGDLVLVKHRRTREDYDGDEEDMHLIVEDGVNMQVLTPGYCRTINKAQGAETKKVIVLADGFASRQRLYTGITRGKEETVILEQDPKHVDRCLLRLERVTVRFASHSVFL
jgi:hypothetical protein